MGLMDRMKAKLSPAREKAAHLADQHGGKVERGLDRAAKLVDEKTKGKYSDKIHTSTDKAKHAVERLGHRDTGTAAGGETPPGGPRPPST